MPETILATKLYIPAPQPQQRAVPRPRLIDHLNDGLRGKLTLVSAPAGFGKTTAVSAWVAGCERPVAWLSLDEADSDPARFLAYLVSALQTIAPGVGRGVLGALQAPQPPPIAALLTGLLNDIAAVPEPFVLVLDDYHVLDAEPVDDALAVLLERMPPHMHLLIVTREDPQLPLARWRVRGQLTELRATDLRFTHAEAADFLNQAMGLNLAEHDIAALDARTEGWIAGLQLAAVSMRGLADASGFIASFTGSHRFVLDYLVEEVLRQQPARVQAFLLRTSILGRLCGPLCDAVLLDPAPSGRETLEHLERVNLFIVPLDNERRWFRYHHLFAELLRQRLSQDDAATPAAIDELHARASAWFEEHGLEIEAFQHAAAAADLPRAERLIEGQGVPLYLRGGTAPVLRWLEALPPAALDARPSLAVTHAMVLAVAGQVTRVEPQLRIAEAALEARGDQTDDETRDLIGRIAGIRALLALLAADPRQIETIIVQSRRALEYAHPDNLRVRNASAWRLGLAYQYQGERVAARQAFMDAIAASETSGNLHLNILASTGLGKTQETDNQLQAAAETYRRVLRLVGDPPGPVACEAHLGLARIAYQWNDLVAARQHGQLSVDLARQIEIANFVASEVFLARLQLAQGDVAGALAALAQTEQAVRQRGFWSRMPEVAAAQVLTWLRHGDLAEAERVVQAHESPVSWARLRLARGDAPAALAALAPWRQQAETRGWEDQRLKALALEAVVHGAHGARDTAVCVLGDALALAEPSGFIRVFLDEGAALAELLPEALARRCSPDYAAKLLAAFGVERPATDGRLPPSATSPSPLLIEPLSPREVEVLRLVAQGLSNRQISERLFLALDTVKGHNRVIFSKLQVARRTEAVARARELELL